MLITTDKQRRGLYQGSRSRWTHSTCVEGRTTPTKRRSLRFTRFHRWKPRIAKHVRQNLDAWLVCTALLDKIFRDHIPSQT